MNNDVFDLRDVEFEIFSKNKGSMLAQVTLKYGTLRIKGFRVMQSGGSDDLYILVPAVQVAGNYKQIFRIEDPVKWKELQNLMIGAYKEDKEIVLKVQADVIDPDSIPI